MSQAKENKAYKCPIDAKLVKDNQTTVKFNPVPIYKNKINFIIGDSGKGKSIWALSLSDLLDKKDWKIISENKDVVGLKKDKEIAYIFQEPKSYLDPLFTIQYQIWEVLYVLNQDTYRFADSEETVDSVEELLKIVGLKNPDYKDKYPHEISGGERQRVMIAMAIASYKVSKSHLKLLVADEPTSSLDFINQKKILNLLHDLLFNKKIIETIVLITHDRLMITDCWQKWKDNDICRCYDLNKQRGTNIENLNEDLSKMYNSFSDSVSTLSELKTSLLKVKKLSVSRNSEKLIRDLSFEVNRGEIIGIVGESGCGKTTLLENIFKSLYSGMNKDKLELYELIENKRTKLQMVFQDPDQTFNPTMSWREIFKETNDIFGYDEDNFKNLLLNANILKDKNDLYEYKTLMNRYPDQLSGGQKQRLALIRVLISEPDLVLADEPFSRLDMHNKFKLASLIKNNATNKSFIIASHDLQSSAMICDRIIVLQKETNLPSCYWELIKDEIKFQLYWRINDHSKRSEYIDEVLWKLNKTMMQLTGKYKSEKDLCRLYIDFWIDDFNAREKNNRLIQLFEYSKNQNKDFFLENEEDFQNALFLTKQNIDREYKSPFIYKELPNIFCEIINITIKEKVNGTNYFLKGWKKISDIQTMMDLCNILQENEVISDYQIEYKHDEDTFDKKLYIFKDSVDKEFFDIEDKTNILIFDKNLSFYWFESGREESTKNTHTFCKILYSNKSIRRKYEIAWKLNKKQITELNIFNSFIKWIETYYKHTKLDLKIILNSIAKSIMNQEFDGIYIDGISIDIDEEKAEKLGLPYICKKNENNNYVFRDERIIKFFNIKIEEETNKYYLLEGWKEIYDIQTMARLCEKLKDNSHIIDYQIEIEHEKTIDKLLIAIEEFIDEKIDDIDDQDKILIVNLDNEPSYCWLLQETVREKPEKEPITFWKVLYQYNILQYDIAWKLNKKCITKRQQNPSSTYNTIFDSFIKWVELSFADVSLKQKLVGKAKSIILKGTFINNFIDKKSAIQSCFYYIIKQNENNNYQFRDENFIYYFISLLINNYIINYVKNETQFILFLNCLPLTTDFFTKLKQVYDIKRLIAPIQKAIKSEKDSKIKKKFIDFLYRSQKSKDDCIKEEIRGIVKFSKENYKNWEFEGLDLSKVDFSETKLQNAKFKKTILNETNFTGANLEDANFEGSSLKNAIFMDSIVDKAIFTSTNLEGANFEGSSLKNAIFNNSIHNNTCFKNANYKDAHFENPSLKIALANTFF